MADDTNEGQKSETNSIPNVANAEVAETVETEETISLSGAMNVHANNPIFKEKFGR